MPFCDHTKPMAERVANLLGLMTQEELCSQTYDKMGLIAKVPSWRGYNWNTECLHGLGAICHTVDNVPAPFFLFLFERFSEHAHGERRRLRRSEGAHRGLSDAASRIRRSPSAITNMP